MEPLTSLYLVPAIPLATRGLLCLLWRRQMSDELSEAAQDRDLNRTTILSMAGFSFTAVAGLTVLEATKQQSLQLPIWFVFVSFVSYFSALNLQSYKSARWHSQAATALIEVGSLSLLLTLVSLLWGGVFNPSFKWLAALGALVPWLADHAYRLSLDFRHLAALADKPMGGGKP